MPDGLARIDFPAAIAQLKAAERIVITTHARADLDAIGSVAALLRVLNQQKKTATAYMHEAILDRHAFLADTEIIDVWRRDAAADILAKADLLVILDTCASKQLGDVADIIEQSPVQRLAIDHHQTRDNIVHAALIDEHAAATALLVTRLCDEAKWRIDGETATQLYCGLAGDTGWFRFSNADADAYTTAARLIEAGVRPNELYEKLYMNAAVPGVRLIGAALSNFELLADGRLAIIRLSRRTLADCGASPDMTEDLVNEPLRIGRVNVSVILVEPEDDRKPVRISFRSKHDVDVAALAAKFGGGGHARASGARVNGSLNDVTDQIIPALVEAIEQAARRAN